MVGAEVALLVWVGGDAAKKESEVEVEER